MKLPRPNIPVATRLKVAQRQAVRREAWPIFRRAFRTPGRQLQIYLKIIRAKLDCDVLHLDHDPALVNRKKVFRNGKHVDYSPRANNPTYLIYRSGPEHDVKTRIRGDGAQHSDLALRRKMRRIEARQARRGNARPGVDGRGEAKHSGSGPKIPSRPFPKRKARWASRKGRKSNVRIDR